MYGPDNVEFMGVLVDRQYTAGQKYAQLVFETAEGIRLSLSRNINMVRELRLGLTYKVKGTEHTVGQKKYIREPVATLVPVTKSPAFFRRYKIIIPVAISLIIVLGGAGALAFATSHNSAPAVHHEKAAAKSVPAITVSTTTPTTSQPTTDTSSTSTSTPQTKTTTVKKSTSSVASSTPAAATTTPAASASIPVTDGTSSIPSTPDTTDPTPPDTAPVDQTPVDPQTPADQTDPTQVTP